MTAAKTWQFLQRFITRRKPTSATEMWMAVWNHDGEHVAIAAPTYDGLESAWLDITGMELLPPMHVDVIQFREEIDAAVDDQERMLTER